MIKVCEALLEMESLVEGDVSSEGEFVVVKLKKGKEKWKPKGMTAQEVADKFNSIYKYSVGKAWQWLKKVEKDGEVIKVEEEVEPLFYGLSRDTVEAEELLSILRMYFGKPDADMDYFIELQLPGYVISTAKEWHSKMNDEE